MPEKLTIWRCPDCGEQVSDELIQDPRTLQYKRGHYHDAPPGWWTEDGPGPENVNSEDPWFDAVKIEVIPADQLKELRQWAEDEADNGAEFPNYEGGWADAMEHVVERIRGLAREQDGGAER